MEASSLVVGCTYYMLTFADVEQTMPGVQPMVYVETDIRGEVPDEPAFYFQDTVSISVRGSINGPVHKKQPGYEVEFQICPVKEDHLGSYYDWGGLVGELAAARSRSQQLGFPRLERATGTWFTSTSS